ncbi:hypothetical protein CY34DRAFT_800236 [Suillus luteus UH-Slu-Lm8-n1]|uniref:Uncharacterized protein n=1 Tax=Suillus luteus UH-Slu-Lm8-n1 TaxID=930992 RepID=A0A0D0AY02_9AGAM|nr:hypothetical protein CY34DRAFT_800236 [Suillus luteus UH-Slu-Lm8-n1]
MVTARRSTYKCWVNFLASVAFTVLCCRRFAQVSSLRGLYCAKIGECEFYFDALQLKGPTQQRP